MSIQFKPFFLLVLSSLALTLPLQSASAANIDIDTINPVIQSAFEDFTEEIGLAIAYLPMAPAEPLGILGFDVGIEVTTTDIDRSLWENVTKATPPGSVIIPKVHAQKGLPFGIDIGAIYAKVPESNIALAGGELKWAFISGNVALPAVAIRASYTKLLGVDVLDLETFGADISISKGFAFLTPYAGYGQVWVRSKENVTAEKRKANVSLVKPFVGIKISIVLINIVVEADFAETPLYTGRINIGF